MKMNKIMFMKSCKISLSKWIATIVQLVANQSDFPITKNVATYFNLSLAFPKGTPDSIDKRQEDLVFYLLSSWKNTLLWPLNNVKNPETHGHHRDEKEISRSTIWWNQESMIFSQMQSRKLSPYMKCCKGLSYMIHFQYC